MSVVNLAVYKEAKLNKEFHNRIKREEVEKKRRLAELAMSYLDQYELEDVASVIYDGDKEEAKCKINQLILRGSMIERIEEMTVCN